MTAVSSPGSTIRMSSATTPGRRRSPADWAREEPTSADSALAHSSQRLDLVGQHGDFSLAYTTAVQSRLKYFGDDRGYIAYGQRLGCIFVLGDPVAAPHDREQLVQQFVARHPRAAFCQISATTARSVENCGYYVNEMGVDTVLPLPGFDFKGHEKKWLRYAAAWTSGRGFTVREESNAQVRVDQVEAVSLAWRSTRTVKGREVRFLNRPMVVTDEPGTRRFYFYDAEQRLLAFVFFDPLFRAGERIGYVACTKRRHPDAPVYAEQAIIKHAIEVFQREGCQELRLGLSPLAWIEDREFRSNRLLQKVFRYGFSSWWVNKFFYNLQGHATYKRRFHGHEEKVYFASRSKLNIVRMMAFVKLCKLV